MIILGWTIIVLKQKSDAFQIFKWYLARVEKEIGKVWNVWDLTEVENLHQMSLICSIMTKESKDRHLHLGALHKMGLLKGGPDL